MGLLAGAYAFRSSENAGENWYEYKMDNGQIFDMRPFSAAVFFVADMMKDTGMKTHCSVTGVLSLTQFKH